MRHANPATGSRSGFTLLEILVALVLIGLLVGTLVPAVLNQLGKGEVNRVAEDLRGLETAAKTFRVDVQRWPADLDDLTTAIDGTDAPLTGTSYPAGLLGRWVGPYLEGTVVPDGDSLATSAGGHIHDNFGVDSLNNQGYLTLAVTGLTLETARGVSVAIDGDTVLSANDTGGRVRVSGDTLYYLAASTR